MKNGKIFYSTLNGLTRFFSLGKESGATFTDFDDMGAKNTVKQTYLLDKDEAIYGLDIQLKSKMIEDNLKLHMVQNNTKDFVPFSS